ncbi:hypothetical protein VTI74DRAFT_11129 [Chaetomium olivicolor]
MKACDANPRCVNVAYAAPGCYLKGEQKPAVNNAAVWGAIRKPKTGNTNPDTPNAPAGPLSCDNKASHGVRYGVPNGGLYQILCGVDYGGNDLDATATESFEACIAACDKNEKCVDVSFVAPSCYMKSALGTPSEVGHVWTAKQLKTASQVGLWPTVGNSDPGEGEEIFDFNEPIELPGAPVAQLGPVPPPGINMAGTGVLTPESATQLWFNGSQTGADGEDLGAVTVRLNITYKYPSIVLDHSIFIKDVVCEAAGALHGRFNSSAPYLFAKDTWVVDDGDVLLITSVPSCISDETTTAFFLTHTVSFDDATLAFEALGQVVELKDVFDDMDVDFGNITVDESAGDDAFNTTCGSPSSDTIQVLPAVPCGFNFDEALDNRRGYYSDNGADLATVISLITPEAPQNTIQRRWFDSLINKVVDVGKKIVAPIVQPAVQIAKAAVPIVMPVLKNVVAPFASFATAALKTTASIGLAFAKNAINNVLSIGKFIVTGEYFNTLSLPLNAAAPAFVLVDSPWGKAIRLYNFKMDGKDQRFSATKSTLERMVDTLMGTRNPEPGIDIYCVDCGAKGVIKATGKVKATPLSGVSQAQIGIEGNMHVGLFIGVNAFAKWEKAYEKELFSMALPGWEIKGIVALGPKLVLEAKAALEVEAEGQIIAGASLDWPKFTATLDFMNPTNPLARSGWTPNVNPRFQIASKVEAKASMGLPVKIWFGIDILAGTWKKGAALVDFPALTGTAKYESTVGTDEISVNEDNSCIGIKWDIALTNEVSFEVDKGPEWTLAEWSSPALTEGCIGYAPETTTSATRPATSTSTTVATVVPTSSAPTTTPTFTPSSPILCPQMDNQIVTDRYGYTYRVGCSRDYMWMDEKQAWVASFEACMEWCSSDPSGNCNTVSFVPGPPQARFGGVNCWQKYAKGTPRIGDVWHSLTRIYPSEVENSRVKIIHAVYGNQVITDCAIRKWAIGQTNRVVVNTATAASCLIAGQDLVGANEPKSIVILYTVDGQERTWVGRENSGTFILNVGALWLSPGSSAVAAPLPRPPTVNWVEIIDVVWGLAPIPDLNVWVKIYASILSNVPFTASNAVYGVDTWQGVRKTAVIFYRDIRDGKDNTVMVSIGIENSLQDKFIRSDGWIRRRTLGIVGRQEPEQGAPYVPTNSTSPYALTNSTALASNTTTTTDAAEASYVEGVVSIQDVTGALKVNTGNNGNLFLTTAETDTTDIAVFSNGTALSAIVTKPPPGSEEESTYLVNGDFAERILHYFPDEAAAFGASRLRLATWNKLPVGSKLISLMPLPGTTGADAVLIAVAGSGEYLYPVACDIENQINRLFLVKDPSEQGVKAALETEDARFVLTGGKAKNCAPLQLVATVQEKGEAI